MFFLAGPDLFRPFCVSWALEAFRSLSGERDRLGSKDGYGMGGKDADLHGCLLSRFAIDFGSAVNIERWMNAFDGFQWPTVGGRQEMLNFAKHTGFEGQNTFLERASLVQFPC